MITGKEGKERERGREKYCVIILDKYVGRDQRWMDGQYRLGQSQE